MATTRLTKAEQSAQTRRALLDAAHELFAEDGYAATSTEAVARRAGVTRGALYYQFRDKAALFAAVYEEQSTAAVHALSARVQAADGDPWQRIVVTACHAFVERAAAPGIRRILYVDGPAVLGQAAMQQSGPGLEFTRQAFTALVDAGLLEPVPLEPLVHLLWGAFFQVAFYIASADDVPTAQAEGLTVLLRVLDGLRPRR